MHKWSQYSHITPGNNRETNLEGTRTDQWSNATIHTIAEKSHGLCTLQINVKFLQNNRIMSDSWYHITNMKYILYRAHFITWGFRCTHLLCKTFFLSNFCQTSFLLPAATHMESSEKWTYNSHIRPNLHNRITKFKLDVTVYQVYRGRRHWWPRPLLPQIPLQWCHPLTESTQIQITLPPPTRLTSTQDNFQVTGLQNHSTEYRKSITGKTHRAFHKTQHIDIFIQPNADIPTRNRLQSSNFICLISPITPGHGQWPTYLPLLVPASGILFLISASFVTIFCQKPKASYNRCLPLSFCNNGP